MITGSISHLMEIHGLPPKLCALQVHQATAALAAVDLPLFTGFVSHEQLEAVIGSTSHERWLASRKELTHWVKMRGPGEQAHKRGEHCSQLFLHDWRPLCPWSPSPFRMPLSSCRDTTVCGHAFWQVLPAVLMVGVTH